MRTEPRPPAARDGDPAPGGLRKGEHVRGVHREVLADFCAHAYNDGATQEAIGGIIGRSRSAVGVLLSESDIPVRARRLDPQRRAVLDAELPPAYHAGASLRELANQHDVSPGTVRRILLDAGVALRRRVDNQQPDQSAGTFV